MYIILFIYPRPQGVQCRVRTQRKCAVKEIRSGKGRHQTLFWGSSVASSYTLGSPGLRHVPPSTLYSVVVYTICSSCQEPPKCVFCFCDGVLEMLLQYCS